MTLSHSPRFEDLLQHEEFVRALARRLVANEPTAADLVQETWLTAMQRPPLYDTGLRAWLSSVVRSVAIDRARSERD